METTTIVVVAGLVLALAGGGHYLLTRRRSQQREEGEPYLHFRCQGCGRRLRFRAVQTGRRGQCSHCGRDVTFPRADQSVD
jgi:DNA-directed RNA polymerase subunit RPC12/RpoP